MWIAVALRVNIWQATYLGDIWQTTWPIFEYSMTVSRTVNVSSWPPIITTTPGPTFTLNRQLGIEEAGKEQKPTEQGSIIGGLSGNESAPCEFGPSTTSVLEHRFYCLGSFRTIYSVK